MRLALIAAISVSLTAASSNVLRIPPALADYRSWTELTPGPQRMSAAQSTACMPMTLTKSHDPHADRWSSVYANPIALAALHDANAKEFPAGAVIAKEKLRQREDKAPEAVAFMIKHAKR